MTKLFVNGNKNDYISAILNKKAILILCKTDITRFGLFIVDPIILNDSKNCSLVSAFNIDQRKEFKGQGKVETWDGPEDGGI